MKVSTWGQSRQYNTSAPRHHLADVIPLGTPYLVHIDPTNHCNFRCKFCPTGQPELLKSVGRPSGFMNLNLFKKIIDDIVSFPDKLKVLHLYKDGEPLLHPEFGKMASYAAGSNIAEHISVTTNAAVMTRERAIEILDAGIDMVRVSMEHVDSAGYRELTRTFGDYERIVRNVSELFSERERRGAKTQIWVKILNFNLTDSEIEKFDRDFSAICDECLVMTPMGWSRTDLFDFTLGTNPITGDNGETPLKQDRIVCPYPFYSLAVNFDGSVSVCCADWSHAVIVGDVRVTPLLDIWKGRQLQELRKLHLQGRRGENFACGQCHTIQGIPEDSDLDKGRERLLKLHEGQE